MRKSFLYILCFVVACQLIGCGGGEEQRRQLAELEEQNHSGQPMQNDTLAEALVAYFDVCLMIRVHLKPLEIAKLKKCAPSYISNIRKSLILKIFGIEGSSELFDDEIGKIGRKDTG